MSGRDALSARWNAWTRIYRLLLPDDADSAALANLKRVYGQRRDELWAESTRRIKDAIWRVDGLERNRLQLASADELHRLADEFEAARDDLS